MSYRDDPRWQDEDGPDPAFWEPNPDHYPSIEERKADNFKVFVDALVQEHLGRITFALEQIQQSYADIQARLVRMEPLIEYAEQIVAQRAKLAKWIPGMKT